MLKRFILLVTSAAAALTLGVPVAQANGPLITNALGGAAKTITATSTNTTWATAAGTMECTTIKLHGNIEKNENTTARGKGIGTAEGTAKSTPATHTGHCGTSSGAVTEFTNVAVSDLHLTKHGAETTGTATFSFTYDMRSATGAGLIAECTWGGTVPAKRTGASTINVNGKIVKTGGSAFCPTEATLNGDFTVRDEFGGAVTIH